MTPLSNNDLDKLAAGYGADFTPDVEAGLGRLQRRINGGSEQKTVVRRLGRRNWLAAAATILLVVMAYFGFLRSSETVFANNDATPRTFELPDGTRATLQQGAELAYFEDFNELTRTVRLSGQAFFEVHKDKTRPFLVGNGITELRVTGTAFNLRVEKEELEVEVSEGSVELTHNNKVIPVEANKCGIAKAGKPCLLTDAPHLNRHGWRTGKLYFEDTELPVVLETLRTNFGFEITFPEGCNYPVSGTFSTDDPAAILRDVARLGGGSVEPEADNANAYHFVGVCK